MGERRRSSSLVAPDLGLGVGRRAPRVDARELCVRHSRALEPGERGRGRRAVRARPEPRPIVLALVVAFAFAFAPHGDLGARRRGAHADPLPRRIARARVVLGGSVERPPGDHRESARAHVHPVERSVDGHADASVRRRRGRALAPQRLERLLKLLSLAFQRPSRPLGDPEVSTRPLQRRHPDAQIPRRVFEVLVEVTLEHLERDAARRRAHRVVLAAG
eukprot:29408-Pelagococcus_subviridis.AAC.2